MGHTSTEMEMALGANNRMTCMTALLCVALAACGPSAEEQQARIDDLEEQVANLEDELTSTRDAAESVRTYADEATQASSNLQDQVARLSHEDWIDVVPDVAEASEEVYSSQEELNSAVTELDELTDY